MNPLEDPGYQARLKTIEDAHEKKANEELVEIDKKIEFENRLKEFNRIKEKIVVPDEINWDAIEQDVKHQEAKSSGIFTIKNLMDMKFPPTIWLVDKLIPAEGFTAITGAPASYKSFITEHLAICIASGQQFLETIPVSQGAVLIIDKENPLSLLQERFIKMGIEGDPEIYFLQNPDAFDINKDDHLSWVINFIKEKNIKLVILDSFAHIHKGDENDSMTVVKTFERLKQFNCAIIFIHHHRKSIKFFTGTVLETIRGSSDIGAEVESHLALDVISTGIKVTQSKNRRAELQKPFIIIPLVTEESIKFEYGGEMEEETSKIQNASQLIMETFQQQFTRQEAMQTFEGRFGRNSIDIALKNLTTNNLLISEKEGKNRIYRPSLLPSLIGNVPLSASEQSFLEEAE